MFQRRFLTSRKRQVGRVSFRVAVGTFNRTLAEQRQRDTFQIDRDAGPPTEFIGGRCVGARGRRVAIQT